MKRLVITLSALALIGASCTTEIQEDSVQEAQKHELSAKLVGSDTSGESVSSVLVCIGGNIQEIYAKDAFKGFTFEPVFGNASSAAACRHNLDKWYKVVFDESMSAVQAAGILAQAKEIRKVQYNSTVEPVRSELYQYEGAVTKGTMSPVSFNDPFFPEQWSLNNDGTIAVSAVAGADIGVKDAWALCAGNRNITVAILDSGISTIHEDLRNSMWINTAEKEGTGGVDDDGNGYVDDVYGYNFIKDSGSIKASEPGEGAPGHGTHVAGIIGAENNNGKGISGIAGGSGNGDGVRLMSCQVFHGNINPTVENIAKAFIYAADNGASIASCSFGSPAGDTFYYDSDNLYRAEAGVEYDAIQYFIDPANANCSAVGGNIIVSSTGNNGQNKAGYPGALKEIIGVSALAPDFLPTAYTNYGPGTNIAAPGGDYHADTGSPAMKCMILSTIPNGLDGTAPHESSPQYGYMQGTSQACPHVSGVVALGMSYALQLGKSFSREEFISMLLTSTNGINSRLNGTKQTKKIQNNKYVDCTLNLEDYYGNMGTGSVDAWKFLMKIEGTPSIMSRTGEPIEVNLQDYMGGDASSLTYLGVDVSKSVSDALGLSNAPVLENGVLKFTCSKVGSGKITVRAIAGGNTLGGGDSIGGMEISQEISIVSRPFATRNGGWL